MDKLSVLSKELQFEPDFSVRPYQTLKVLIKFRNSIAHGRSDMLTVSKDVSSEDEPQSHNPRTENEEYCNLNNAKRAKEDVSKIIEELHSMAGLGDCPFRLGITSSSISLKEP